MTYRLYYHLLYVWDIFLQNVLWSYDWELQCTYCDQLLFGCRAELKQTFPDPNAQNSGGQWQRPWRRFPTGGRTFGGFDSSSPSRLNAAQVVPWQLWLKLIWGSWLEPDFIDFTSEHKTCLSRKKCMFDDIMTLFIVESDTIFSKEMCRASPLLCIRSFSPTLVNGYDFNQSTMNITIENPFLKEQNFLFMPEQSCALGSVNNVNTIQFNTLKRRLEAWD